MNINWEKLKEDYNNNKKIALVLEPGDATRYNLVFLKIHDYAGIVVHVGNEQVIMVRMHEIGDIEAFNWNEWTLHLVFDILNVLMCNGEYGKYYDWNKACPIVSERNKI